MCEVNLICSEMDQALCHALGQSQPWHPEQGNTAQHNKWVLKDVCNLACSIERVTAEYTLSQGVEKMFYRAKITSEISTFTLHTGKFKVQKSNKYP